MTRKRLRLMTPHGGVRTRGIAVGTFVLHRFNGDEVYSVKEASMKAFTEDETINLFLYVDTKVKPIQTLPDTEELKQNPNAELYIFLKKLDVSKLVGRRFSVPMAYSEE